MRILWYLCSIVIFETKLPFPSALKVLLLRCFGAVIGRGVVIKPAVKIKYPWFLKVGSYTWVGEGVWIDNLYMVDVGENCCLSQGAMILTGNHDYKVESFDLIVAGVELGEGVWLGAKSVVCPGVAICNYAVISVGSVVTGSCEENGVYQGNPCFLKRKRFN